MRSVRWGRLAITSVVGYSVLAGTASGQQATGRQYTVEDVLRTEGIGAVVPSPDGSWIAVVIQRPRGPREIHAHYGLVGPNARGDVWVVRRDGSELHAITNGGRTGAGYWNPVWSPDGRWLAMLSTEGGDGVRAWLWRRDRGGVRRADAREVDLMTTTVGGGRPRQPLAWLDTATLLLPLLPLGTRSHFDPVGTTMDTMATLWAAARAGESPTASVLDTEERPSLGRDGVAELIALDVGSVRARTLAIIPRDPTTSGVRSAVPSPDGRWIAVQTSRLERPEGRQPLTRTMSSHHLGLVSARGDTGVRWVEPMVGYRSRPGDDWHGIIRWSPDGARLAAAGTPVGEAGGSIRMFVIDTPSSARPVPASPSGVGRSIAPHEIPGITPRDALWTIDGQLLVLGAHDHQMAWWAAGEGEPPRAILPAHRAAPELIASTVPGMVYVASDSALDVLDIASGTSRPVSASFPRGRVQVIWPTAADRVALPPSRLLVEVSSPDRKPGAGEVRSYLDVALEGARATVVEVSASVSAWRVDGYLPASRELLVIRRNAHVGVAGARGEVVLVRRNAFLDDVLPPRRMLVPYRGGNGDSLHAVLLLPAGHRPGDRYPLVTWVYAGAVYTDTARVGYGDPYLGVWLNLLLLVSHGYAVLFPSMPVAALDDPSSDQLLGLTAGVLPAVDRVIEMGIADPRRLAVMGQSYGGYSTLGLVTLTNQFQSAIAISPLSNHVSDYGSFHNWTRFHADAHLPMANQKSIEAGQQSLGIPLWGNPWRYLINSPVFHLHRVQTPVLLIQGDQDFPGTRPSEEVFTGLYRLGKRARFVRYWGEQHSIDSPANIRDVWARILAWLDETLNATPPRGLQ